MNDPSNVIDEEQLWKESEALSASIFFRRNRIREDQAWLDENEPIFANMVARLEAIEKSARRKFVELTRD